jgi:hypothetical protein
MIVQPPMKATAKRSGRVRPAMAGSATVPGLAVLVDFAFAKMCPFAGGWWTTHVIRKPRR